jgi:hypothetical protein
MDFPLFDAYFKHELDFSWQNHEKRLLVHNITHTMARIPTNFRAAAKIWLFKDMQQHYDMHHGIELPADIDYSAALLQSNDNYEVMHALVKLLIPQRSYVFLLSLPCHENLVQTFEMSNFQY